MSVDRISTRIQILSRDSTARTVQINTPVVTIGGVPDADIRLADTEVADWHARIEFDGKNYKVVDLDSESGTYLDEVKLLPGVPQVWESGQVLKIGQYWFYLERGAAPDQVAPNPMFEQDSIKAGFDPAAPLMLELKTPHLTVAPGSSVTASVVITNVDVVAESCQLTVEGIPTTWVSMAKATLQLPPGRSQTTQLIIRPPRSAESRAGKHSLTVRVSSQKWGDETTTQGSLIIGSFTQFQCDLIPQRLKVSQTGQVLIENQGNAPQAFTVTWQDWADELTFKPPRMEINVAPGEKGAARFRAQPRRRRWLGGKAEYAFTTQVSLPGGDTQKLEGELISRATLSVGIDFQKKIRVL